MSIFNTSHVINTNNYHLNLQVDRRGRRKALVIQQVRHHRLNLLDPSRQEHLAKLSIHPKNSRHRQGGPEPAQLQIDEEARGKLEYSRHSQSTR